MGFDSGLTSITGNVSVSSNVYTSPAASQTMVKIHNTCNGANQTAYTVTAGKTFYILGFSTNQVAGTCLLQSSADAVLFALVPTAADGKQFISSVPIYSYAATTNVRVNGPNTLLMEIWGFEQ